MIQDGAALATPFLDLGAGGLDLLETGDERGLLGLAFHPGFATATSPGFGKFYVYYSEPGGQDHNSVISEFQVSADPNIANANSERMLLRFSQPFSNHNGGDLHFGPDDELLYISTGDGGSGGDPLNNAQNRGNLLGKILRIDVDGTDGPGGEYGIPASNPFRGQSGARDEIYAYGLRNPYRFSFDDGPNAAAADRLFAGDVGQEAFEEVDLITSGGNYGWRIREGAHPFNQSDPDPGNLTDPIAEYANALDTDAVIGGFVYRGTAHPSLQGKYLFGDLLGKIFLLEEDTPGTFSLVEPNIGGINPVGQGIIGFGQDEAGELYVLTFSSMLAVSVTSVPIWHNAARPLDASNDGEITPVGDVLPLINELNFSVLIDGLGRLPANGSSQPPPFYDVSGDCLLTAVADVLPIINHLNSIVAPEGEFAEVEVTVGESSVEWFVTPQTTQSIARRTSTIVEDVRVHKESPLPPAWCRYVDTVMDCDATHDRIDDWETFQLEPLESLTAPRSQRWIAERSTTIYDGGRRVSKARLSLPTQNTSRRRRSRTCQAIAPD